MGLLQQRSSLEDYLAAGGGRGLERARSLDPTRVVEIISASGLRGRGGAGFPTGTKWRSFLGTSEDKFVVCNAAEGEPATFKDRLLMRRNPYQVLEGVAIAALVIGAQEAYVGLKNTFRRESDSLQHALNQMHEGGLLDDDVRIHILHGPDRYLLGEETGLLGTIDGRGPFPREVRPFMQGLFASTSRPNPTLVNNVETLANVPPILDHGPDWLRQDGTDSSPGTMLFTVAGDVEREGVFELPLGTPLRDLVEGQAGGPPEGRPVKAVLPGASSGVIVRDELDVPLDFDEMRRIGSGLGAGGFAVYDESACMLAVTRMFTKFLHIESCAQCPACKVNSGVIDDHLNALHDGVGTAGDLEQIVARAERVTDGQKCALPTGTKLVVLSLLHHFVHEFAEHIGKDCPRPRQLDFPKLVDYDEEGGRFTYDLDYKNASAQWSAEPSELIDARRA